VDGSAASVELVRFQETVYDPHCEDVGGRVSKKALIGWNNEWKRTSVQILLVIVRRQFCTILLYSICAATVEVRSSPPCLLSHRGGRMKYRAHQSTTRLLKK